MHGIYVPFCCDIGTVASQNRTLYFLVCFSALL